MHSMCIGGAIDLACACDMRFATNDARFTVKEIDVSIAADVGTLQRFPKIVGSEVFINFILFYVILYYFIFIYFNIALFFFFQKILFILFIYLFYFILFQLHFFFFFSKILKILFIFFTL